MARNPLVGMAKQWLKEQVATDHRADERIDRLQWQARREVEEQIGQALLPGLHRRNQQADAAREQRRAEEEAARRSAMPLAGGGLAVTGSLTGPLPTPLLVDVDLDGDVLLLGVEAADGADAEPGTVPLQRLDLAIPGYTGRGTYDLRAAHTEGWDPLWFGLALDVADEPFWWVPDTGPCTVVVGPTGLSLEIAFADAMSRSVVLRGGLDVALPPA